jgi:hypothetical protein
MSDQRSTEFSFNHIRGENAFSEVFLPKSQSLTLWTRRAAFAASKFLCLTIKTEEIVQKIKIVETNHWKALEELLMVLFSIQQFSGGNAFSEFFSKNLSLTMS